VSLDSSLYVSFEVYYLKYMIFYVMIPNKFLLCLKGLNEQEVCMIEAHDFWNIILDQSVHLSSLAYFSFSHLHLFKWQS